MNKNLVIVVMLFLLLSVAASASLANVGSIKVDTQSTFPALQGKTVWVVYWTGDMSAESLNVYLTPTDISSASGQKTSQSFSLSASNTKNTCSYDLAVTSNPKIIKYTPLKSPEFWIPVGTKVNDWINANCIVPATASSEKSAIIRYRGNFGIYVSQTVYCVGIDQQLATPGRFTNPTVDFTTNWTAQASGKPAETSTIGSAQTGTSTKIGENVYIKWLGNLVSGASCPSSGSVIPISSNTFANGWRFADSQAYQNYLSYYTAGFSSDLNDWMSGTLSYDAFKSVMAAKADAAVAQASFYDFRVTTTSTQSGRVSMDLNRLIQIPTFQVLIDADYLELVKTVGVFNIVSASEVKFTEGAEGTAKIVIKNVGTGEGEYEAWVVCGGSFSSPTTSDRIINRLPAGDSTTLSIRVLGSSTSSTDSQITGECTAYVRERTTQQTVTKKFGVTMQQISECVAGQLTCGTKDGVQAVLACNGAGLAYDVVQEKCTADKPVCSVAQKTCVAKECTDPAGCGGGSCEPVLALAGKVIVPNLSFSCLGISGVLGLFKVFLALAAAIFGFIFGFKQWTKWISKDKVGGAVIMGFIVAALLFFFTYIFSLWIVAVLIVVLIIWWIIGRFI